MALLTGFKSLTSEGRRRRSSISVCCSMGLDFFALRFIQLYLAEWKPGNQMLQRGEVWMIARGVIASLRAVFVSRIWFYYEKPKCNITTGVINCQCHEMPISIRTELGSAHSWTVDSNFRVNLSPIKTIKISFDTRHQLIAVSYYAYKHFCSCHYAWSAVIYDPKSSNFVTKKCSSLQP